MTRAAALAIAALALLAPAHAVAQDCPRTTLGDIEDEVMCPICGTPLGLANEAPQAQQQRAFIEEQIADCRSKEEIKQALVAQFGEGVLALPGDESGEDDATHRLRQARVRRDQLGRAPLAGLDVVQHLGVGVGGEVALARRDQPRAEERDRGQRVERHG